MRAISGPSFQKIQHSLGVMLVAEGMPVDTRYWQAQDISDQAKMRPTELQNAVIDFPMPQSVHGAQEFIGPNLPWAEDHFLERVSGQPLNPPPSHVEWPFARKGNEEYIDVGKFSHTYPERFWPKMANVGELRPNGRRVFVPHQGIRYAYGDFADVIMLMLTDPQTRQAYLPIFFPEDTGAVEGQRIPCTLGYQFMLREQYLHCTYFIRSCDFLRHFPDDVYMAVRLAQHVANELAKKLGAASAIPGNLTMHMTSLHVFEGDMPLMRKKFA